MENPWLKLNIENSPYILDCDREIVNEFNERKKSYNNHKIRLDNLPTPFAGDFENAKILLLQLNPGSEILPGLEPTENHEFFIYKNLKNELLKSLRHNKMDYPFYWLNPDYMMTGGFKYWVKMFPSVINNFDDYKKIANNVCCVQYFPYHSKNYGHINKILESQNYSFNLVEEFIKKPDRMIILMRAENYWLNSPVAPKLKEFGYSTLKSNRNPVLSRRNFTKEEDYNRFFLLSQF